MAASDSPISKKPQPLPWSHQETLNLIKTYQEKWYSLQRGQLRSNQWEEVAVTVAARCGYDESEPSKSSIQCRHKMEKLRQRYRAEKQRLSLGTVMSSWPYFDLMDLMERGPFPISSRPLLGYGHEQIDCDDEGLEELEVEEEGCDYGYGKLRSLDYIMRRPTIKLGAGGKWVNGFSSGFHGGHGGKGITEDSGLYGWEPMAKRVKREVEEEEEEEDENREDCEVKLEMVEVKRIREKEMALRLAAEIKGFAKRLVGMERMKMEIMKETENSRIQMENKRLDMIVKYRHKTLDSIAKAFESTNPLSMVEHDI